MQRTKDGIQVHPSITLLQHDGCNATMLCKPAGDTSDYYEHFVQPGTLASEMVQLLISYQMCHVVAVKT